jgi:hypothetical protein
MFITKMSLPRRTFLRGVGATIALPLLDAMVPALSVTARTAAAPVPRMGFFYVPNGMYLPNFHPAGEGGTSFEFTPTLKPLEPFRRDLVVVSGLSNLALISSNEGGGAHSRPHAGWLNGVLPKRTEGSDITAGKTIDQYAADRLGVDTPLRSLEITTESNYTVGNCEGAYSCSYINSTSWRGPHTPLPHESDPRAIFHRLFGDGGTPEARLSQLRQDRSILDWVTGSLHRLEQRLGPGDRRTMSDYLDAVRDVERRIQRIEETSAVSPLPSLERPAGVPDEFDAHAGLLLDLLVLAYQADVTRVSCMQFGREQTGRTYPEIGVAEGHHDVSHHQRNPHLTEQYTKVNAYHVSIFAKMVEKMRATPDGDGTLLDHAMLIYGAAIGDGDQHTPVNLPIAILGGACGHLRGGRHLKYALNTPFMNLGLTLLDKVDVHVEAIGDSTGRLTDL